MTEKLSLWNRGFICIVGVNFFMQMGQQMMNTLIPKYADYLGASAYLVGLMSTAFGISALVTRPFAAPAFDVFSKRKLLAGALGAVIAVYVVYGLTENYGMIIIGRMLQGVCMGSIGPLCLALAGETLPNRLMASGIGVFSMAQAVAQALGPNLGLEVSRRAGYPSAFFTGAGVILAALVFTLLLPEKPHSRLPYRIAPENMIEKNSIHPAVLMFLFSGTNSCINSYLAIYGALLGVEGIGLYFSVFAVCMFVARPISGRLIDRYGYTRVLIPSMVFFMAAFVVIGFSRTLPAFLVAGVVNAFGCGVCYPATQSLAMSCAPGNRRGAAASTNYYGTDSGLLIGPFCAGLLVDRVSAASDPVHGYSTMFFMMVIPLACGVLYYLVFRKKIQEHLRENALPPPEPDVT